MVVANMRLFQILLLTLALVACGGQPPAEPTTPAASAAVPTSVPTSAPTLAPTTAPTAAPTALVATATAQPTVPAATATPAPIQGEGLLVRGSVSERPFVVMIDNHPNAYPQSGLDKASLVFEALAEFGLTRFMAVYEPAAAQQASQIGPVRSTRLYFVQWAMPFNGMYVHAGGSPEGLALAESTDQFFNLDGLFRASASYFQRSSQRAAPHNLYTSGPDLARAIVEQNTGSTTRSDIGYLYKADADASQRPAKQTIDYFFLYREDGIGWIYDPTSNSYSRFRRGRAAVDAVTGAQLQTRNIIVMEVAEAPIAGDEKGRIEQQVIGSGKARLYQDGLEREISWNKGSPEEPLTFLDPSGTEVQFNAGQIWLVALPDLNNLSVDGS